MCPSPPGAINGNTVDSTAATDPRFSSNIWQRSNVHQLPTPAQRAAVITFTANEKETLASAIYRYVWRRAVKADASVSASIDESLLIKWLPVLPTC